VPKRKVPKVPKVTKGKVATKGKVPKVPKAAKGKVETKGKVTVRPATTLSVGSVRRRRGV
jgi:hypothetical protein